MKVFLNGKVLPFMERGYTYVFVKPFDRVQKDEHKKPNGDKLILEMYDNGVQIRTLVSSKEVNTIINREIAVDQVHQKIYILEADTCYERKADGSIELL